MERSDIEVPTSDQSSQSQDISAMDNDVKMAQEFKDLELESNNSDSASDDDKTVVEAETNDQLTSTEDKMQDQEVKKKKNKKKKPKPTGFEDYYVDAPLAPAEYLEEKALYSQEKSFSDRLFLAITRYTSRRRFSPVRLNIFDKYLAYGGVGTGIKQFQGGVDEKASDLTAAEIALEKSKYLIQDETSEGSVVDFDAVVRGFLTSYLPSVCEDENILAATQVIRNFLNYLLYHDVCPEYADQIYDAKKSCDEADHQMTICTALVHKLPGSFNKACSLIFGGHYHDIYIEDAEQAKALGLDPGMRREEANKIFLAGLAAHGTEEMVHAYNAHVKENSICIPSRKTLYLEVTATCSPSAEVLELYSLASQSSIRPIGTVKFQSWRHPDGPWPEMTPEEVKAYKVAPYKRDHYELCLEADLLPEVLVGTKICCTYYETSFGLRYFDSVIVVLCPMYTWLYNDAMMDWVPPKELPPKSKSEDDAADDDDNYVVVGGNIPEDIEREDNPEGNADNDDVDIPPELEKYEKGEDIVVTL